MSNHTPDMGWHVATERATPAAIHRTMPSCPITPRAQDPQDLQSHRLAIVGSFAGGIVHDFKNLTTVILGSLELLRERQTHPEDEREVEDLIQVANRADSLTRRLLQFMRNEEPAPQIINLNTVIADLRHMLQRFLGSRIKVQIHSDPALGQIEADRIQIQQLILNLAANARDAMPEGGTLFIETDNREIDLGLGSVPTQPAGPYVVLTISDTGCGMDDETLSHIFEPFYSTKERHLGTGLGLSTVRTIVQTWGGHIEVRSVRGRGTTLRVFMPRTRATAEIPPRRVGHVLLIEANRHVREIMSSALRRVGYQVSEASGRQDAAALCVACDMQDLPVASVVCDVAAGVIPHGYLPERPTQKYP